MKLRLPKGLFVAVTAAGIVSGAHAAMTMPNEGTAGHVWTWDGSAWTRDAGAVGNGPSRSNNIGAFGIFTGDKNSHEFGDSSDGGGILVKENVTVTNIGLGAYGGTIQVNKGGYLNAWSANLKNDSTDSNQANVWVDGILNLRGFNAFDNGATAKDHNWHVGNNGLIILENTSTLNKNGKKWNLELVIGDEEEISGLTNRTREIQQQQRTVIRANGKIFSQVDKLTVFNTSGTALVENQNYTIDKTGHKLIISFDNYLTYKHIDLIWDGGANGEWKHTENSWKNDAGETTSFINGDTVTFSNTSSVTVDGGIEVAGMTVSGDNVTLTLDRKNSGYIEGNVEIKDNATLIINSKTDTVGFVRGEINVVQGTLQFDQKDVTGYNGGVTSTQKITIASGSTLVLNHDANETFAGTLILNGTLKGGDKAGADTRWDLFGGSATIEVKDGNQAKLENVELQLRQNGTNITIGTGASLSVGKISRDEGNGVLNIKGSGELIVTGTTDIQAVNIENNGKLSLSGGGSLGNVTLKAQASKLSFGAADSATASNPTSYTVGELKADAVSSTLREIDIEENAVVNAVNVLNPWGLNTLTVNGVLNVSDTLKFSSGNNTLGQANILQGNGAIVTKKLDFSNVGNYTIQDVNLTVSETSKISPDTYKKTTQIKNAVVDFGQLTFSHLATLLMESGSMTMSSTDGKGNLDLRSGQVTLKKGTHKVANLDMSTNNSSATALLKEGAVLEIGTLNMNKGDNNTAKITLEKDAEVKLADGVVSVKGISSAENEKAEIFAQHMDNASATKYSTGNNAYRFKNADVSVNSSSEFNLTNCLDNSSITNNGTGTVNLKFGASDRTEVHALKGSINMMWMGGANPSTEYLTHLEIANNLTVGAQAADAALANIKNYATLSVTESVRMGANATVAGHLTINSGASLTLGGWNETAAQVLGNLTLGTGLTLGGAALNAIEDLQFGESLVLFDKVSGLVFIPEENTVMTLDSSTMAGIDASTYFSNLEEGIFYISHEGQQVIITSNIPEPTTATLNLLALAALAARRRRK